MASPTLGPWAQARLPASWRGVPFRVKESQIKRGRRQAVHEYPFRDTVWVEDLGRATRVTSLRGFLVGDDVDSQLRAMVAAAEMKGTGTLVHPALGNLTASIMEFVASDSDEQGRVWQLDFSFISSAERSYPVAAANTQSATTAAAAAAPAATSSAYATAMAAAPTATAVPSLSSVLGTVAPTIRAVQGVEATIGGCVAQANGLVSSAGAVARAAIGLSGNFGRFSLGARLSTIPGLTNVQQALTTANAAAASVSRLGSSAASLAAKL